MIARTRLEVTLHVPCLSSCHLARSGSGTHTAHLTNMYLGSFPGLRAARLATSQATPHLVSKVNPFKTKINRHLVHRVTVCVLRTRQLFASQQMFIIYIARF
jgi:hypothetical protein